MDILIYIDLFIIGTVLGSFYNVLGIRVPEKETLMGRSHCPKCGHTLGWWELIPVLGYILLRGKCKNCKSPISIKYPLMELLTGLLFVITFVFLRENMVEYILVVVFISLMVIVTVSDLYYRIVPDIILIVFLPVILVLRILSPEMLWYEGLIGGVLGFGFLYLIALYGKFRFKQEALGGGDIKLYALIGIVLGYQTVFLSLFFAAISALIVNAIVGKKRGYIPFVPFIFFGAMVAYFIGDDIISWYSNLFI